MSTQINDGGPAFPQNETWNGNTVADEHGQGGMTLRDYFAANASEEDIQEFLPATVGVAGILERQDGVKRTRHWARYAHADAMLRARKGGSK